MEEDISSLSDGEMASLMAISSDEEDEEPEISVATIQSIQERMETMYAQLPPEPDTIPELFFYAAQSCIFFAIHNGRLSAPDPTDTMEVLKNKAIGVHLHSIYLRFSLEVETLAVSFYEKIRNAITSRNKTHPLLAFMEELNKHKELHSRRIKGNPGIQRTKLEISKGMKTSRNLVNDEVYDVTVSNHHKWKWLIINPLPSDEDYRQLDPLECDEEDFLNIQVQKIRKEYGIPDPYSVIVTHEMDKLLRLLHTILHIEDYIQTYIVSAIPRDEFKKMEKTSSWDDAWKVATTDEWANKSLDSFSREKKKTPIIISRLAEMRDLLKVVVHLTKA